MKKEVFSINSLLEDMDDTENSESNEILTEKLHSNTAIINEKEKIERLVRTDTDIKNTEAINALAYIENLETKKRFLIKKEDVKVGCGAACDLIIQDSSAIHTVSRFHATIKLRNGKFYICDNSTNGTFLYEEHQNTPFYIRIPRNIDKEITDGQIIRFADVSFVFKFVKDRENG